MKTLKHILTCICLLAFSITAFSGCRTAEGFGEDMERAGEEIQEETQ
jgi:predicted small secreted protein